MVNLAKVLYVTQPTKNLLSASRLVSKGVTMGDTQDKTTINKNGVSMILDEIKGKNTCMMIYLKTK